MMIAEIILLVRQRQAPSLCGDPIDLGGLLPMLFLGGSWHYYAMAFLTE